MIKKIEFALFAAFISLGGPEFVSAMATRPPDPNSPQPPAWAQFVPFIVILGVMYFLLIRPQIRQKKDQQQMLNNLKKGDMVVTQGGLIGSITNIQPGEFEIKIAEEARVKILKSSIVSLYKQEATSDKKEPAQVQ